ncbi:MAG: Flp family type IVb pilin [Pararhodobacter sp.]|nr:Flp family type IVb pilin [Pararhodobacter sp.]
MLAKFKHFLSGESGATAIEYGLIAALVAVAIIGALTALGVDLTAIFTGVSSELQDATP